MLTQDGPLRLEIPRDRDGSFEPTLLPKYERRFTVFDDKATATYARGVRMRDLQTFMLDGHSVEVSTEFIRSVTDTAISEVFA